MSELSQAAARRETRALIGHTEGQPYDQATKVARFAAWVCLFRETFPDPYRQISDGLNASKNHPTDWSALEMRMFRTLTGITRSSSDRDDPNIRDLWAGSLTAAVHTVSIVRSAPIIKNYFQLPYSNAETAIATQPALTTLIMEDQDKLGDIKNALSPTVKERYPQAGSYTLQPHALEMTGNGKIRFKPNYVDGLPIMDFRKEQPDVDGVFTPNHGEQVIGDIQPRDNTIGCPISFINGFGEDLLRATAETADRNGLFLNLAA